MTTTLAEQLKSLQREQGTFVPRPEDRVSLIFSKEMAETYSNQAIWEISVGALNILRQFNPDFGLFPTLFGEASIETQRVMLSKKMNDKLNLRIHHFMLLLSSYLPIMPAQQALEWLLRRFYVHKFNQDDLMACCLVHCNNPIFPQIVNLMDIKESKLWSWLLQLENSTLSYAAIGKQCLHNSSLLSFLVDLVNDMVLVHGDSPSLRDVVEMYSCVTKTVIKGVSNLKPNRRNTLVSAMLSGFQKQLLVHVHSVRDCALDLSTSLSCAVLLSPEVVEDLSRLVVKSLKNGTDLDDCLVALCIFIKHYKIKPSAKNLATLCQDPGLFQALTSIVNYQEVDMILLPILDQLISKVPDSQETLRKMVEQIPLDYSVLKEFLRLLKDNYDSSPEDGQEALLNILKDLESKYPALLDTLIETELANTSLGISLSRNHIKFLMCGDNGHIFQAIHHERADVRAAAIHTVIDHCRNNAEDWRNTFLSNLLRDALNDSSPEVVSAALTSGNMLFQLEQMSGLEQILASLLLKIRTEGLKNWINVELAIVKLLSHNCSGQPKVLALLTPFALIPSKTRAKLADHLSSIPLFENIYLPNIKEELKADVVTVNSHAVSMMASNAASMPTEELVEIINTASCSSNPMTTAAWLLVVGGLEDFSQILPEVLNLCTNSASLIDRQIQPKLPASLHLSHALKDSLSMLEKGAFPEIALVYCLATISRNVSGCSVDSVHLVKLFRLLIHRIGSKTCLMSLYFEVLKELLTTGLGSKALPFLVCSLRGHQVVLQEFAMALAAQLIQDRGLEVTAEVAQGLLASLSSPWLVGLVFSALKACSAFPYPNLHSMLLHKEAEITMDSSQAKIVARKWLKSHWHEAEPLLLSLVNDPKLPVAVCVGLLHLLEKSVSVKLLNLLLPLLDRPLVPPHLVLSKLGPQTAPLFSSRACPAYILLVKHLPKTLDMLTSEFLREVPDREVKIELIAKLLDHAIDSDISEAKFKEVLTRLIICQDLVVPILEQALPNPSFSFVQQYEDTANTVPAQIVLLLEVLQSAEQVENRTELIPVLCQLLQHCQALCVERIVRLILGCLISCAQEPRNLRIDLVMNCLQPSYQPQTNKLALHLLTLLAPTFREEILSNLVNIFTFMGRHLARHDTEYSYQLLTEALSVLIPVLLPNKGTKAQSLDVAGALLQPFVECLHDMPATRRELLYPAIFEQLDPDTHLWIFISQCLLSQSSVTKAENQLSHNALYLDTLLQSFSATIRLSCSKKLLQLLRGIPLFPWIKADPAPGFLKLDAVSEEDLEGFALRVLGFLEYHFMQTPFPGEEEEVVSLITELLDLSMVFLEELATQEGFPQKFQDRLSTAMVGILRLMTTSSQVQVFRSLLRSSNHTTLSHTLRWVHDLVAKFTDLSNLQRETLLSLVKPLLKLTKSEEHGTQAVESLGQLSTLLTEDHTELASKVTKKMASIMASDPSVELRDRCLGCLDRLCQTLEAYSMLQVPLFLPTFLDLCKPSVDNLEALINLLHTLVTLHGSIILNDDIVLQITYFSCKPQLATCLKMKEMRDKISEELSLTTFLDIFDQSYSTILEMHPVGAKVVCSMLGSKLSALTKQDVEPSNQNLCSFFDSALEFRQQHLEILPLPQMAEIEASILDACVTWLGHVAGQLPVYLKHFLIQADNLDLKTTYILLNLRLVRQFGQDILPAFNIVMKESIQLLKQSTQVSEDEAKWEDLLDSILDLVTEVARCGPQILQEKKWFKNLVAAVVEQLDSSVGGDEKLVERAEKKLGPCLGALLKASDPADWRDLNKSVLERSNSSRAAERLAMLHSVLAMVQATEQEYNRLLPDTEPVLAQLVQDLDLSVEELCHMVMCKVEGLLSHTMQIDI